MIYYISFKSYKFIIGSYLPSNTNSNIIKLYYNSYRNALDIQLKYSFDIHMDFGHDVSISRFSYYKPAKSGAYKL